MPKVKRNRTRLHAEAAASSKTNASERLFAVQENAVLERMEVSGDQAKIVASKLADADAGNVNVNKKLKRKIRHDTWMQKLDHTHAALNKSKKSKKNQLTVDLSSFKEALASVESVIKLSNGKGSATDGSNASHAATSATAKKVTTKKGRKNTAYVCWTLRYFLIFSVIKGGHAMVYDDMAPPQIRSNHLPPTAFLLTCSLKEVLRFQKVLQHPAFKANPLATIQQHIKNTLDTVQRP
ncbi:hypothetical protein BC938DRAFT_478025 [Jimgerdemannia flammicorona]|uniref:Ribosome biogenesis protein SLX9 n=1 Tax=Jimgerdemannia flammicorona TaxID=994334 RepID=A0A433QNK1_9FUNG|nr:hypothetical protein BC938DRAFT_478025 [Jimgerdemannia flammicorona]